MKRSALLPLLIGFMLLLPACAPPAAQPPATQPTAAGVSQQDAGGATEVDITLADNTIQSTLTTFKVGVPYKFVIINNGLHQHSFSINPPVEVAGSLEAATSSALVFVSQQKLLPAGGSEVVYTFPASAAGQKLEMSCLIRRHYDDGMRLAITVTK